jgi:hypothetical protein
MVARSTVQTATRIAGEEREKLLTLAFTHELEPLDDIRPPSVMRAPGHPVLELSLVPRPALT